MFCSDYFLIEYIEVFVLFMYILCVQYLENIKTIPVMLQTDKIRPILIENKHASEIKYQKVHLSFHAQTSLGL